MYSRQIVFISLFFCSYLFSESSNADPFIPTDPDKVIARWHVDKKRQNSTSNITQPLDAASALSDVRYYLAQAIYPGQSHLFVLAQARLQPLIASDTTNVDIWLSWAQIQQYLHEFDAALAALTRVVAQDSRNQRAILLASHIYLIQGKSGLARQMCMGLMGHSDMLTLSGCLLEATSQEPPKLAASYEQLHTLIEREGFPNDERGPWLAQLLADMAMRMGNHLLAIQYLEPLLANGSTNLLAQWAQAQLASGHYQQVVDKLAPIVRSTAEPDDALLLPLAIAEKSLGNANHIWQQQFSERAALREQRQDKQHAKGLARYFLDVNQDPRKALYWAQLNYENSREASDRQLVERAQLAVTQSGAH
jgi:hypothetical protein